MTSQLISHWKRSFSGCAWRLRHALRDPRKHEEQFAAKLKLTPIASFEERDLFIVGFPKSGHTWMQNMMAALRFGIDVRVTPDAVIQDLVPDIHALSYYKRYASPMVFKSHHLPRPEYRRVIYMLRDGRDALVSYLHFLEVIEGRKVDFLQYVESKNQWPSTWQDHVEAWLANPYKAEMLVLKYEGLRTNCLAEMKRVCDFAGMTVEEARLQAVIEASRFENMRQKEKEQGLVNWPTGQTFVRRGVVGSFKDEMPETVLHAFLKQAGGTLAKCGYLDGGAA